MTTVKLKAFYNESGVMSSDEDIQRNLMLLPDLLKHMLEEGDKAEFTKQDYKSKQVEIAITASCEKDKLEKIIKVALKNSNLVGTLIC